MKEEHFIHEWVRDRVVGRTLSKPEVYCSEDVARAFQTLGGIKPKIDKRLGKSTVHVRAGMDFEADGVKYTAGTTLASNNGVVPIEATKGKK